MEKKARNPKFVLSLDLFYSCALEYMILLLCTHEYLNDDILRRKLIRFGLTYVHYFFNKNDGLLLCSPSF